LLSQAQSYSPLIISTLDFGRIEAVALHHIHYNFCRIHQSLRVTPGLEVGVSDHVWSLEEVIDLLD
jgi:hypothetical protein